MLTAWATAAAMVAISVVEVVLLSRSGCRLRLLSLRRESLPRSLPDLRREELRLRSLDRSRLSRPRSSRPRTSRRSAPSVLRRRDGERDRLFRSDLLRLVSASTLLERWRDPLRDLELRPPPLPMSRIGLEAAP
jgi:hypothetical protein